MGPEFNVNERFSNLISIFWIVFMYSSGLPFLYLVLFVTLLIIYMIDKSLIFKFYRRKNVFGQQKGILLHFVVMLKFGIFLHLLTGSLMFANSNIFEADSDFDQV